MSNATETPTENPVPTIAGGFTIPTSPRRRLQNIQNDQARQPVAPSTSPSSDEQMSIGADEHLRTSASEQVSKDASEQTRNQADEQVREQSIPQVSSQASTRLSEQSSNHASNQVSAGASNGASTQVSKSALKPASNRGSERGIGQASNQASAYAEGDSVEARVREMLAMKRTHPGGTKGSVDMAPDLMKRVKRYLLDNGDPSFRILVIELVEAFLDKEGY